MKKCVFLLLGSLLFACAGSEEERPAEWYGKWEARWETLPESYPGIEDMEFYMDGNFTFTADSLTVQAFGFEGCIFNTDTLIHTQSWSVSNDTLILLNQPGIAGITYKIKSKTSNNVELQLLEDIFVTLSK